MIKTNYAELIKIDDNIENSVQKAKKLYLEGIIFVHPTDTVYGFAANPFNDETVKRLSEIKEREIGKKYILLIKDIDSLLNYVDFQSEKHLDFLLSIWPNPVSVVLKLNKKTSEILNCDTTAFRIPNHRFSLKLLNAINMPMISTSVNKKDSEPLNDPIIIRDEFGSEIDAIFYSNHKSFGESSTLIDLSKDKPSLIRAGRIKFENLLEKFNRGL